MPQNATPTWDLSILYNSITDPQCQQDLATALDQAQRFETTYRGTIGSADSAAILKALQEYEAILQLATKPVIYGQLLFSADSSNPTHGAFLQKAKTDYTKIYQMLIFFELELARKSDQDLQNLIADPILANYAHFLKIQLAGKPHRLSEAEEKILADKNLTGASALTRLFDEEMAAQRFNVDYKGETKELSEAQTLDLLYSHDRAERQAAAKSLTKGLNEGSRRISFIYNTLAQDKAIDDRYMRFETPEASRHFSNQISQEIVDTMSRVVTANYDVVSQFYNFKKGLLGLDQLYDYDRYAPLAEPKQKYTFDEARELVLIAYTNFSPKYAAIAQEFFDKQWIDAATRPGKAGGAFCMYVTPDTHPFIFLNYSGTINQVSTLAHELGHGVHASLMRAQTMLNFDTPLTMAETSSVFGEMLLFDHLKNTISDKQDKLALYVYKIESIFATVYRQIAMYRFEQDFHKAYRETGELSIEQISDIWMRHQKEMFGDSLTVTPDYAIWWTYIQHFFHTPFYVYAYAFGELLTLALYARYKKKGATFADKYLELLKAGGSKSPQELLTPLGIDLTQPSFWQEGIDIIKNMLQEAQQLV